MQWKRVVDPSGVTYELQVSIAGGDDFTKTAFLVVNEIDLTDTSFTPVTPLPQQDKTPQQLFWRVQAKDGAGGASGFSEIGSFTLDAIPPVAAPGLTMVVPLGPSITREKGDLYLATFEWGADSDAAQYEVSLDDEPVPSIVTSNTHTVGIDFGELHILRVKAFDDFGNESLAILFVIDDAGESTSFTVATEDSLPLGDYRIDVNAQDKLDHQSDPATIDFSVTPPVVTDIGVANQAPTANAGDAQVVNEGATVTLDGTESADPNGDVLTFSWAQTAGPFDVTLENADTASPSFLATDNGAFTFELTVADPAGLTGTATVVVPVNNVDPTLVPGDDQAAGEGDTVEIASTFADAGVRDTHTATVDWGDESEVTSIDPAVSPLSASHVYGDEGEFTVTVTVTDDDQGIGVGSLVVVVSNVAPTIVSVVADPSQLPSAGGDSTITVTATDPAGDNDPLLNSFDCDGDNVFDVGPQAGNTATCSFTEEDVGVNTVNVQVDDQDGGVVTSSTTVTVFAPPVGNLPPTVIAGPDQTVNEGDFVALEVDSSSDPDNDPTTFSWTQISGAAVELDGADTANPSFTAEDDAILTFQVEVSDGELSDTDTIVVTVNNSIAPTLEVGSDQSAEEGDTVRVAPNFADVGALDTYTAVIDWGDETDLTTIDPAVSPLSASHVYADNGAFTVTVSVTDDDGGVGADTLTVTVSNVAPEVDAGPDQAAFLNETVTIAPTFDDIGDADTHTATIDWGDGSAVTVIDPAPQPLVRHPYLHPGWTRLHSGCDGYRRRRG